MADPITSTDVDATDPADDSTDDPPGHDDAGGDGGDASDEQFAAPTGPLVSSDAPGGPAVSRWARWRERSRRRRIERWERPPQPRDWRFFVGGLGKVLIVSGMLLFGFVAYQLWGTGIETARAQSKLEGTFQERIAAVADTEPEIGFENWVVPERPDEPESDPSAEPVDGSAGDAATEPGDGDDAPGDAPPPDDVPVPRSLDEVPVSDIVPGGLDLSDFAVDQDVPVVPGDSFARLDIPTIGVSEYIVPGVQLTDLKRGPGHFPDTPLPGQLGNAALAGHRTTYGAPFFDLDQLAPGDELEVTMVTGDRFVYRVTGLQIVNASDYWVVTTRDPNVAELTLTTCDPKYTARNRLVVHSVLVPEKSAQVGEAEFYEIAEADDAPIPGDDPTFDLPDDGLTADPPAGDAPAGPADESPTEAPDPADAEGDEPASDDTDNDADEPGATTGDEPASDEPAGDDTAHAEDVDELREIDAFSQGWFHDRDAWPHIGLWGLALVAISALAYRASKWARRYSVGFALGVAPFVVCLYFFYQNVNRLLPPGL